MIDLLTVKNLSIYVKKTNEMVVKNVNFTIRNGESLVLLGQSGSGKTMTCRAIMNLLNQKQFVVNGSILFYGKELINLGKKEKQNIYGKEIAFIPQNPMTALNPSIKIEKQMKETLSLHSNLKKSQLVPKIKEALYKAGFENPEYICLSLPYMLSGGMLQRVIIAMALMLNVKLIVADEPTTALDALHRNETIQTFISLKNEKVGVLMVTHDFSDAFNLGGKLYVMKDGHILVHAEERDAITNTKDQYTRDLINASFLSKPNLFRR